MREERAGVRREEREGAEGKGWCNFLVAVTIQTNREEERRKTEEREDRGVKEES